MFFLPTKVLLKLRTSVDAKDGADKSSIVDNLRYESTGYNSVAEHFLGFLVSSPLAALVKQLSDYHKLSLEEAEAVREDPTRRGAQLRALLAQREALLGAASTAAASKRKAAAPAGGTTAGERGTCDHPPPRSRTSFSRSRS